MPATIVMGGQWGDEGKGKLTDALAGNARMVVRANGGSNAGHTVKTDLGTFKLHLIPSGILNDDVICVIGAGVVIDLETITRELGDLRARGIDVSRLRISDRAHIVLPYHAQLDRLMEVHRQESQIGTTLRGNGPAYADKVGRHGIRVGDLLDESALRVLLQRELDRKNAIFARIYDAETIDFDPLFANLLAWAEELRPMITATEVLVQDVLHRGEQVLVECAQGAMLDIDYGSYPYVTSSSPTAAGACQGAGVAPTQVERVLGVYKAYSTRVGSGPMPTELHDGTGEMIRQRGNEYGTTTGRPRRTGWFDGVAAKQTGRLNGVTEVALTLVDVLDAFDRIQVCNAYTADGTTVTHLPANLSVLDAVEPVYTQLKGWNTDTTEVREYGDLPAAAKDYIAMVEGYIGAPVKYVGVGPAREQLIVR